jgi:hypothetical protein
MNGIKLIIIASLFLCIYEKLGNKKKEEEIKCPREDDKKCDFCMKCMNQNFN